MAINNLSELVSAIDKSQKLYIAKSGITSVAGIICSSWTLTGSPQAGGTPPTGAGEVPTKATTGALFFTNPTGGNITALAGANFSGAVNQSFFLYDRLVHTSGLVGNSASAQTVNSVAVNRPDSTGEGAQIFLEVYTATGGSATTVTASYTNQAGTSGRTTISTTYPASMAARYSIQLPLQAGDTGVRSVESITLAATTGTAGNIGVTIARPVFAFPAGISQIAVNADFLVTGLAGIDDDACLFYYALPPSTSAGALLGYLFLAQG